MRFVCYDIVKMLQKPPGAFNVVAKVHNLLLKPKLWLKIGF